MIIKDRIYGDVEINEPVLVELMQSKALQRLKGINQHSTLVFYNKKYNITRYEHSVGVMILLREIGAKLKEQIAGLLHDINHTAFAHVMDKAFGDIKKDDYSERFHEKILMSSDIPQILEKHSYDAGDFVDEKKFTLLEKDMPGLCADRLDYFFRDTIVDRNKNLYEKYRKHLAIKNREIVLDTKASAEEFVRDFLKTSRNIWTHPTAISIFEIMAQCFKMAYEKGYLKVDDYFVDDNTMMGRLKSLNDPEINRRLGLLNEKFSYKFDSRNYDFHRTTKARFVDPFVMWEGKRISEVSPRIKREIESFKQEVDKGYYFKVRGL